MTLTGWIVMGTITPLILWSAWYLWPKTSTTEALSGLDNTEDIEEQPADDSFNINWSQPFRINFKDRYYSTTFRANLKELRLQFWDKGRWVDSETVVITPTEVQVHTLVLSESSNSVMGNDEEFRVFVLKDMFEDVYNPTDNEIVAIREETGFDWNLIKSEVLRAIR